MAMRWFSDDSPIDDGDRAVARSYDTQRPFQASAQRIDLTKTRANGFKKTQESWQQAAWNYVDQIGELWYAFNLIGQLVSRVTCNAAFIEDAAHVPVASSTITDTFEDKRGMYSGSQVLRAANVSIDLLDELFPPGLQGGFIQRMAIDLSIAGELYIVRNDNSGRYVVASPDELVINGSGSRRNTLKTSRSGGHDIPLPDDAYIARVWRSHPRYSADPTSSMRGVLDACEQLVTADQTVRSILRSRMAAGMVYIPGGLTALGDVSLEDAIAAMTIEPVEDETSRYQVTPLVLTGPETLGGQIKRVDLSRPLDETIIQAQDRALERILRGIDVPKDVINGLADIKYANAISIDDNLFRAHIEPLIMLICDALTSVYLQPAMKKAGVDPALARRFVVWYNPSQIVTRPDRSQAANEGYDRFLLSGDTWRTARGFTELDAPSDEEVIGRIAREKTFVPPELTTTLIESIAPKVFEKIREEAQSNQGFNESLQGLLSGQQPAPDDASAVETAAAPEEPAPESEPPTEEEEDDRPRQPRGRPRETPGAPGERAPGPAQLSRQGGEIPRGGELPPRRPRSNS